MSSVSSFLILVYSFITDTQVATDLFAFVVLQPECICVFQAGELRAEALQRFQHGVPTLLHLPVQNLFFRRTIAF